MEVRQRVPLRPQGSRSVPFNEWTGGCSQHRCRGVFHPTQSSGKIPVRTILRLSTDRHISTMEALLGASIMAAVADVVEAHDSALPSKKRKSSVKADKSPKVY